MSRTLTLNILADMIAGRAGCDPAMAEKIAGCYIAIVTERISSSGHAAIEGIGEFSVSGIGGNHILFRPDNALARKLNEPFEMFEPVELDTDFPIELLETPAGHTTLPDNSTPEKEDTGPTTTLTENETSDRVQIQEAAPSVTIKAQTETEPETTLTSDSETPELQPDNIELPIATEQDVENRPYRRPWRGIWLAAGFIAGIAAGSLLHDPLSHLWERNGNKEVTPAEAVKSEEPQTTTQSPDSMDNSDTMAQLPQDPVAPPKSIVETVRVGYDITHMAKKHYGNRLLWVYIYDANPSLPANPNHIQPGTEVIIPDIETLDIDPASAETLTYARKRASEIYGSL